MKEKQLISLAHVIPHLRLSSRDSVVAECQRVVIKAVRMGVIPIESRLVGVLLDHIDRVTSTKTPTELYAAVTNFAMWIEDKPWSPKPDEPVYKDAWSIVERLSFIDKWKIARIDSYFLDVEPSFNGEGRDSHQMVEVLWKLFNKMGAKSPVMRVFLSVGPLYPLHGRRFEGQVMWMTDSTISIGTDKEGYTVAHINEVRDYATAKGSR